MSLRKFAATLMVVALGYCPAPVYGVPTPNDIKEKCITAASYLTEAMPLPAELRRAGLIDFAKFPIKKFLESGGKEGPEYQCNPVSCKGTQNGKECAKSLLSFLACFTYQEAYSTCVGDLLSKKTKKGCGGIDQGHRDKMAKWIEGFPELPANLPAAGGARCLERIF